jgi:hypothetical protein
MKLTDYRKKANELGGKLKVRSNSLGRFVGAVNADGIEIPSISSKEFHEANRAYYDLLNTMQRDPELREEGYVTAF